MRSLFSLVILASGILFIAQSCDDFFPDFPTPPSNNATPADSPTAGHAVTPNPFHIASKEWLWDSNGVYLLASGSNIAHEILSDLENPVANVQGVVYSKHNIVYDPMNDTTLYDYFVWIWTPIAVYRYQTSDGKLLRVLNPERQDIRNVIDIIAFPGHDNKNDEVWLWTIDNFYRMSTSNFDDHVEFRPYPEALMHIQAIKPSPDPGYIFLWTVTDLFLYDIEAETLNPILNPAGDPIPGVQGIWIDPITTVESGAYFFTVVVWNELDLYQMQFAPGQPYTLIKIVNSSAGAMNGVIGVAKTLKGGNAALWAWTSRTLYLLPTTVDTKTYTIELRVGDVMLETIKAAAACPDAQSPLYVWNESYLMAVNQIDRTVQLVSHPNGTTRHNGIRQVIPCPMALTGMMSLPDEVWWWDAEGVYRRQTTALPATPILTPEASYLPQVRGMMIGLYQDGQQVWIWNEGHVYYYLPESGWTREILGPDGEPLANVWMVQMRPERNEPGMGYTILIRNNQNVYQYMVGNDRAVEVTIGNERRAISSPPYTVVANNVVLVGQSAQFAETGLPQMFLPRLNTVLRPDENAAAIIESGSGHCNNVAQDC